jgi:hypothetical protein
MDDDNSNIGELEETLLAAENDSDSEVSEESSLMSDHDWGDENLIYYRKRDLLGRRLKQLVSLVFGGNPIRSFPRGAFGGCEKLQNVIFREGLQCIAENAFLGCISLTTISFPSSLRTIFKNAFANCGLQSIDFNEGLRRIHDGAFSNNHALKKLKLPQSLISIGDSAFQNCRDIASVDFGMSLQAIGKIAFARCDSLRVIHLPESLATISTGAFAFCRGLKTVEFSSGGPRLIEANAFESCNCLTNILPPSSPADVSDSIFRGCQRIANMYPTTKVLLFKMRSRCENRPVHAMCFRQSYLPLDRALEELVEILVRFSGRASNSIDCWCDEGGMTPFHILALSSRPEIGLFETLQAFIPRWTMDSTDQWGCRPIEYLGFNSSIPMVERQRLMDYLANETVKHRAHKLGLPQWRLAVLSTANKQLSAMARKKDRYYGGIYKIEKKLDRYEFLEGLCLLELSLWKMRLPNPPLLPVVTERRLVVYDARKNNTANVAVSREDARTICGAGIVIPRVLSYLD